jgi:hypothetical protein
MQPLLLQSQSRWLPLARQGLCSSFGGRYGGNWPTPRLAWNGGCRYGKRQFTWLVVWGQLCEPALMQLPVQPQALRLTQQRTSLTISAAVGARLARTATRMPQVLHCSSGDRRRTGGGRRSSCRGLQRSNGCRKAGVEGQLVQPLLV